MTEPVTAAGRAEPLRKITACSCGHPLTEHYANGCGWCICKVAGTATEDADQATTTAADSSTNPVVISERLDAVLAPETVPYLPAGYGPKLAVTWVPYLRDWADSIDRQRRFGGRVPLGKRFIISATLQLVADKIEQAAFTDADHSVTDASGGDPPG